MIIFAPLLYNIFIYLGDAVGNQNLSMRFYELSQLFRYSSAEGTIDLRARLEFYRLSIDSLLSNPILGVGGYYGYDSSNYGVGGHSGFLDELARFGLIGSMFLFIGIIKNIRFVYGRFRKNEARTVYFCSMLGFFILGMINTIFFIPIAAMVFFVVPGLLYMLFEIQFNIGLKGNR
jgi:O-antigen ligase